MRGEKGFTQPFGAVRLGRAGFTLIELMLVVIIIGALTAMVMPRLAGRTEQAKVGAAQADISANIATALKLYELDNGRFPSTEDGGLSALFNKPTEFARTPKYRIEGASDEWVGKKYRQSVVVQPLIELALGLYFTATVFYALANQIYGTVPFLVLFQIGFLYTGILSVVQQYASDPVVLNTQVASGK